MYEFEVVVGVLNCIYLLEHPVFYRIYSDSTSSGTKHSVRSLQQNATGVSKTTLSSLLAASASLQSGWLAKTFRVVYRCVASSQTVKERGKFYGQVFIIGHNRANPDHNSYHNHYHNNTAPQLSCQTQSVTNRCSASKNSAYEWFPPRHWNTTGTKQLLLLTFDLWPLRLPEDRPSTIPIRLNFLKL